MKKVPIATRFWAKVDKRGPDECWLWMAGAADREYGSITLPYPAKRQILAHRFSWELHNGPIPEGLVIDHLCRTPLCVNPRHLEPVTPAENTRRGWPVTKTHCIRGHELTPDNLYVRKSGHRQCAPCVRDALRKRRAAAKAAATADEQK